MLCVNEESYSKIGMPQTNEKFPNFSKPRKVWILQNQGSRPKFSKYNQPLNPDCEEQEEEFSALHANPGDIDAKLLKNRNASKKSKQAKFQQVKPSNNRLKPTHN